MRGETEEYKTEVPNTKQIKMAVLSPKYTNDKNSLNISIKRQRLAE